MKPRKSWKFSVGADGRCGPVVDTSSDPEAVGPRSATPQELYVLARILVEFEGLSASDPIDTWRMLAMLLTLQREPHVLPVCLPSQPLVN
jgi:hypothetical protein